MLKDWGRYIAAMTDGSCLDPSYCAAATCCQVCQTLAGCLAFNVSYIILFIFKPYHFLDALLKWPWLKCKSSIKPGLWLYYIKSTATLSHMLSASSNDCYKMKEQTANSGKVMHPKVFNFQHWRSYFKFSQWQWDPQVSDNENVSENAFIFIFRPEWGACMPLPDSNLERCQIDNWIQNRTHLASSFSADLIWVI